MWLDFADVEKLLYIYLNSKWKHLWNTLPSSRSWTSDLRISVFRTYSPPLYQLSYRRGHVSFDFSACGWTRGSIPTELSKGAHDYSVLCLWIQLFWKTKPFLNSSTSEWTQKIGSRFRLRGENAHPLLWVPNWDASEKHILRAGVEPAT